MKRNLQMIARRLRAVFSQALRPVLARGFPFAKYQIDARCPVRYMERKLRRKVRNRFRLALD